MRKLPKDRLLLPEPGFLSSLLPLDKKKKKKNISSLCSPSPFILLGDIGRINAGGKHMLTIYPPVNFSFFCASLLKSESHPFFLQTQAPLCSLHKRKNVSNPVREKGTICSSVGAPGTLAPAQIPNRMLQPRKWIIAPNQPQSQEQLKTSSVFVCHKVDAPSFLQIFIVKKSPPALLQQISHAGISWILFWGNCSK